MIEVPPWAGGGCRAVDTLVMPSCSHQCHGGQGGKRIPEVPLTRARVNPRPSSCVTFLSMRGAACILGCGVSARESPGSEDQQRQPDRPLRPPAWLPGTVFTELHTGDRAGAEQWDPLPHLLEGQEGVPYCQQSPAPAQGEWGARGTQHPGHRCGTKGPRSQNPASGLLGAPS